MRSLSVCFAPENMVDSRVSFHQGVRADDHKGPPFHSPPHSSLQESNFTRRMERPLASSCSLSRVYTQRTYMRQTITTYTSPSIFPDKVVMTILNPRGYSF